MSSDPRLKILESLLKAQAALAESVQLALELLRDEPNDLPGPRDSLPPMENPGQLLVDTLRTSLADPFSDKKLSRSSRHPTTFVPAMTNEVFEKKLFDSAMAAQTPADKEKVRHMVKAGLEQNLITSVIAEALLSDLEK